MPSERMRPVPCDQFKINARHVAELMWGTGGTHAYRTNRIGAYYYSCSAHGGYVVDHRALTLDEQRLLSPHEGGFVGPHDLNIYIVEDWNGVSYVSTVSYVDISPYARHVCGHVPSGAKGRGRWYKHRVYLFEEDCDWSILEKLTDIRRLCDIETPEKREAHEKAIEECFRTWHSIEE